jgi:hypothetical protein
MSGKQEGTLEAAVAALSEERRDDLLSALLIRLEAEGAR